MRALSVRQPWAWAIARGHKPVVNRASDTGYRGPVAIYASLGAGLDSAESRAFRKAAGAAFDSADPMTAIGGIVAVVTLDGVCRDAVREGSCRCGEWASPGAYHWRLADPRPLRWPVLAVRRPGLWELVPQVADGVARLLPDEAVRAGGQGRAGPN